MSVDASIIQNNHNKEDDNHSSIGGFMAGTHLMHRTNYGPNSPLPGKAKVFFMIQHHLVANWQIRMAIPISLIELETGVPRCTVLRSLRDLEKDKMLLVERRKLGRTIQENIYRLHPSRFGENPLYQGPVERPTFQVIPGGKIVDIKTARGSKSATTPSSKSATTPSSKSATTDTPLKPLPPTVSSDRKNLKELSKNTTEGMVDGKGLTWEQAKTALLVKFPNDTHRLDECYRQIKESGLWLGTPVYKPANFILSCWVSMRSEFQFVDELIRSRTENKNIEEPIIDENSSSVAREEAMKRIRSALNFGNFK